MGLTEAKIKDLEDKKFDQLFKKHKAAWLEMVEVAYTFTKEHITDGNEPRADDILKTLLPTLEVSKDLRDHQEDVRARFKRFREYFGEYIIDRYLTEKQSMKGKIK
jgi:hypothetical protein